MDNNTLIYNDKPYKSVEESLLYYKIALEEAIKTGDINLIMHYQIMINYLENNNDNSNNKTK